MASKTPAEDRRANFARSRRHTKAAGEKGPASKKPRIVAARAVPGQKPWRLMVMVGGASCGLHLAVRCGLKGMSTVDAGVLSVLLMLVLVYRGPNESLRQYELDAPLERESRAGPARNTARRRH